MKSNTFWKLNAIAAAVIGWKHDGSHSCRYLQLKRNGWKRVVTSWCSGAKARTVTDSPVAAVDVISASRADQTKAM